MAVDLLHSDRNSVLRCWKDNCKKFTNCPVEKLFLFHCSLTKNINLVRHKLTFSFHYLKSNQLFLQAQKNVSTNSINDSFVTITLNNGFYFSFAKQEPANNISVCCHLGCWLLLFGLFFFSSSPSIHIDQDIKKFHLRRYHLKT